MINEAHACMSVAEKESVCVSVSVSVCERVLSVYTRLHVHTYMHTRDMCMYVSVCVYLPMEGPLWRVAPTNARTHPRRFGQDYMHIILPHTRTFGQDYMHIILPHTRTQGWGGGG